MKTATYSASFRNKALAIRESGEHWLWSVTNSETGEEVAEGEAIDRATAMVQAAEAAEADWGSAKWRRDGEGEEEE